MRLFSGPKNLCRSVVNCSRFHPNQLAPRLVTPQPCTCHSPPPRPITVLPLPVEWLLPFPLTLPFDPCLSIIQSVQSLVCLLNKRRSFIHILSVFSMCVCVCVYEANYPPSPLLVPECFLSSNYCPSCSVFFSPLLFPFAFPSFSSSPCLPFLSPFI